MNNNITFGVGGVVVGVILGMFLVSVVTPYRNESYGMMRAARAPFSDQKIAGDVRTTNAIDRHFIEQMIPHHEGAIAMAQLAQERAVRPEIRSLATAIIQDQTKEIGVMADWYKDWFGTNVPRTDVGMGGGMMSGSGMHMGGQEDMALLANATDFDKAFLEAMIPHHQLALMMAQMLETGTNRPEMLQLARDITTAQAKEIEQMREWYTQWYQ